MHNNCSFCLAEVLVKVSSSNGCFRNFKFKYPTSLNVLKLLTKNFILAGSVCLVVCPVWNWVMPRWRRNVAFILGNDCAGPTTNERTKPLADARRRRWWRWSLAAFGRNRISFITSFWRRFFLAEVGVVSSVTKWPNWLFFQYLAVCSNEHLPNSITIAKVGS